MKPNTSLTILDLGTLAYRPAWDRQLEVHVQVSSGELAGGALMLVEHLPVITIGRRAEAGKHLLASPAMLQARGVEVVETDRGGDITFHGPGQLVVYPIINLNAYGMNLHGYMRFLEEVVMGALRSFGVEGVRSEGATGVWVRGSGQWPVASGQKEEGKTGELAKICAMGVKLRRWVTLHGLALNVTTDLSFFELINPCGLGKPVTSLQRMLGAATPAMADVKASLTGEFEKALPLRPDATTA